MGKEGFRPENPSGPTGSTPPASPPKPALTPNERRRHPRFAVRGSSSVDYLEGVLSVFGWGVRRQAKGVLDLSLGGARLKTETRLEPGSVLRVRFRVEAAPDEIEVYGHTRWSSPNPESSGEFHTGVMFFNVTEEESRQLSRLQEHLTSSR
jgi:hypothetical protein